MKRIGLKIDEIFDVLKDLKWHTVGEISEEVSLPKPIVRRALKLMAGVGQVEYVRGKAKIDRRTLEWLRATERDLSKARHFGSSPSTCRRTRLSRRRGAS